MGKVELPKRREIPELACVEPAQLSLEGVLVARGISRAFTKASMGPRQRQTTPMTSCDREGGDDFQGTDVVEHRIIKGDLKPIRKPPYRVPFALRK